MDGVERIAAERQRQIDVEGWTPEHDDEHGTFQLSKAATAYAVAARNKVARHSTGFAEAVWPWDYEDFKPSDDPIRNLEKAGALIAAEIDRLLRRQATDGCG